MQRWSLTEPIWVYGHEEVEFDRVDLGVGMKRWSSTDTALANNGSSFHHYT